MPSMDSVEIHTRVAKKRTYHYVDGHEDDCKQLRSKTVVKDKSNGDGVESAGADKASLENNPSLAQPSQKPKGKWTKITRENLDLDYIILYTEKAARRLFEKCEAELVYNIGDLAKVRLFGKWIDIPRKQVAHGDAGLSYTFSGQTVPARPWTPLLLEVRDLVSQVSGHTFNFVLINRYHNGNDYMGEHKDDERELCPDHPIASLSLGQERDFVFKHQDSRGKNAKRRIDTLSISLQNGSLLMMNNPTNQFWYHSLPKRAKARGPRINFTFRKMVATKCKSVDVGTRKEKKKISSPK